MHSTLRQLASAVRDIRRFESKFDKGKPNECWIWRASKSGKAGVFCLGGRLEKPYRVSYCIYKGTILKGLEVMHSCDNPACVNPSHLSLGTHLENMQDMSAKRRGAGQGGKPPSIFGEKHPRAKLKEADIPEIRRLASIGELTRNQIGALFGVQGAAITKVVNGQHWQHMGGNHESN